MKLVPSKNLSPLSSKDYQNYKDGATIFFFSVKSNSVLFKNLIIYKSQTRMLFVNSSVAHTVVHMHNNVQ